MIYKTNFKLIRAIKVKVRTQKIASTKILKLLWETTEILNISLPLETINNDYGSISFFYRFFYGFINYFFYFDFSSSYFSLFSYYIYFEILVNYSFSFSSHESMDYFDMFEKFSDFYVLSSSLLF